MSASADQKSELEARISHLDKSLSPAVSAMIDQFASELSSGDAALAGCLRDYSLRLIDVGMQMQQLKALGL